MIEVIVRNPATGQEYALLRIVNISIPADAEEADYYAEFAIERGTAVGLHKRSVKGFPRLRYNVLALIKAILDTLTEKELELEDGIGASDLAWGQHQSLREVQGGASQLHHHGPAFRSEQPEQHGGHDPR